ncbi:MAG: hypothetical protein ACRDHG_02660 [Anaerolineales bacterium]
MSARGRAARLICLLVFAAPLLTACNEDDVAFITALAKDWAAGKGLLDSAGNPDIFNIGLLMANPSSDPQAAAALEAGLVVKGIEDADRLAQEGAETGDVSKINAAIRSRPGDWSYQEQKAALLLAQDNSEAADSATEESESLVRNRISAGGDCRTLARNMYSHRLNALQTQIGRGSSNSAFLKIEADFTRAQLDLLSAGQPVSFCP